MSQRIVVVHGSPSATSRSTLLAGLVVEAARRAGVDAEPWSLADFDAGDVFHARTAAPAVARFVESVRGAAGIVLATPVYKAAYSGALKAIVDLIPPDALVDRPALGIGTARIPSHGVEVDRALRALFVFFRARAVETLVVLDDELTVTAEAAGRVVSEVVGPREPARAHVLSPAAEQRVQAASRALVAAVVGASPQVARP
jgi:FMN reductase